MTFERKMKYLTALQGACVGVNLGIFIMHPNFLSVLSGVFCLAFVIFNGER